jgi:mono/diheme cytochrome c family protein
MTRPNSGTSLSSQRRGRAALVCALLLVVSCAALGCLVPWKQYTVLPGIEGRIATMGALAPDAHLKLIVRNRDNVLLNATRRAEIDGEGRFAFDAIGMSIAGQEYTRVYRVFLHLQQEGEKEHVIWRANIPRHEDEAPMTLACLLDRPAILGEPCRLRDAPHRDWLVAQGQTTFRNLCASCHGDVGAPTHNGQATSASDLTQIARRAGGEFDRDAVAHWIEGGSTPADHGEREMPVWGQRLSEQYAGYAEGDELVGAKIDPLLAYLERIQRR